jgi:3-phenylpropionate/trans-cinnamate dioxygenase ferredoxin subunit
VVGTVDEIPPGGRKIVQVAGRSIGVFNVGGDFLAVLNRCPHQGGPLCLGNTHGFLRSAAVGEFDYSRPGEVLRCPWHGWEYDLRTGQSWFDPATVRVQPFDVRVESGAAVLQKGPYVAETYPVTVEREYLIVEIGTPSAVPSD